jgi:organic radical activating enzyme
LQLDAELIDALHAEGFEIAVETNGTIAAPAVSTGSASAPRQARRCCKPAATS